MEDQTVVGGKSRTRRSFVKQSGAAITALALSRGIGAGAFAGENNTIKVALVGCGGRGTGAAANALSTEGPVVLWSMADVFDDRVETSLGHLVERFPDQVEVPPDRRFVGFDAFRHAMDTLEGPDVVILATPPAFRPLHLEAAVDRGLNVFMEKSFAVDAPGVRRVLAAGQKARRKNLKIAGGLMERHHPPLEEAIARIHAGEIGDVVTAWVYRKHGPVGFTPRKPGMTELLHQIRNYSNFTWLNGSFILDWLIHNLDVACWAKGAWPVSAQGDGGRQVRDVPDQLFDHYSVEYSFPDGTRMMAQGRHMQGCWEQWGDVIHGSHGCAIVGEGVRRPRLYRGHAPARDRLLWQHEGEDVNAYQVEQDLLFRAIREDAPYNEVERSAYATLTGIMGRMAAETGEMVTWEDALSSDEVLAPGLDAFTYDATPPVEPGADGGYPVAMPGIS